MAEFITYSQARSQLNQYLPYIGALTFKVATENKKHNVC